MTLPLDEVRARAAALGFTQAGAIRAAPAPTLDAYLRWIEAGMHGAMGYLARPDREARRRDLNAILPGVQSLVIVALDYGTNAVPESVLGDPRRGRISNYAWGADYHAIMTPRLERLAAWLRDGSGDEVASRVYVDTGAILERSHAQQAGLGFVGKNTMLIHPRRGSFMFLGEISDHRRVRCLRCSASPDDVRHLHPLPGACPPARSCSPTCSTRGAVSAT